MSKPCVVPMHSTASRVSRGPSVTPSESVSLAWLALEAQRPDLARRVLGDQSAVPLSDLMELQRELRANPRLIPEFVEEAVRLESSFRGHYRCVKRDTELGGVERLEKLGCRVRALCEFEGH